MNPRLDGAVEVWKKETCRGPQTGGRYAALNWLMLIFAGGAYAGVFDGQRVGFFGEGGEGGRYLGQAGPDVGGHGAHGA
jgi:hypothetical protein